MVAVTLFHPSGDYFKSRKVKEQQLSVVFSSCRGIFSRLFVLLRSIPLVKLGNVHVAPNFARTRPLTFHPAARPHIRVTDSCLLCLLICFRPPLEVGAGGRG